MQISFSVQIARKLKKIKKKDYHLYVKFKDCLVLLQKDKFDPRLRTHKLIGFSGDVWSFSVSKEIRVLFRKKKEGLFLTDIGTYDEVY